jgi:hypothetical protein
MIHESVSKSQTHSKNIFACQYSSVMNIILPQVIYQPPDITAICKCAFVL